MDIIAKTTENQDLFLKACSSSCGGVEGAHGECCNVSGKNWILGRVDDWEEVLFKLQAKYPNIKYEDAFMDFEEGRTLFPHLEIYQNPESYPIFRIKENGRCTFYEGTSCTIYNERSSMCFKYYCAYLKNLAPFKITSPGGHGFIKDGRIIEEEVFRGVKDDLFAVW